MTADSGKHGRRIAVSGVGFIAIALVAAGCAEDRRVAKEGTAANTRAETKALVVPARIVPPVTVARIEGAPEIWQLRARVAKALRDRAVPAVIEGPGTASKGKAGYVLNGRTERLAPAKGSAAPRIRIAWTLHDAQGKRIGSAQQIAAHPVAADAKLDANIDRKPDPVALERLARIAAERLTPLVPQTAVNRAGTRTRAAQAGGTRSPGTKSARAADPIWRRVAAAPKRPPVTALGKQDAQRGDGGLSARFLKLRNVSTVAARSPEERIALKRRAAQPHVKAQLAGKRAEPPVTKPTPVIQPAGAEGPALTRQSVVTERLALIAKSAARKAAHAATHKAGPPRAAVTPVAASGGRSAYTPAIRKPDTIRPAPHARKFPVADGRSLPRKVVQIAEAAGEATKGFWVQLASNPSPSASRAAWQALVSRHGALLERQPHAINRADLGRKGVYYRLQLGPYPNIAQAKRICASLRAKQVNCLLMAARGQVAARGLSRQKSQGPAARRVVTKPLAPGPKAKAPMKAPVKAKRAASKTDDGKTNDGKSAAGKASAVRPAAGARPDPKADAKPRSSATKASLRSAETERAAGANRAAKPSRKPGLGARAEKPATRADKLPFQRSKALPGLPD